MGVDMSSGERAAQKPTILFAHFNGKLAWEKDGRPILNPVVRMLDDLIDRPDLPFTPVARSLPSRDLRLPHNHEDQPKRGEIHLGIATAMRTLIPDVVTIVGYSVRDRQFTLDAGARPERLWYGGERELLESRATFREATLPNGAIAKAIREKGIPAYVERDFERLGGSTTSEALYFALRTAEEIEAETGKKIDVGLALPLLPPEIAVFTSERENYASMQYEKSVEALYTLGVVATEHVQRGVIVA